MEAIFIPVAALCAWLIGEKVATKAARRRLNHVVQVNGTRGKTAVSRLIQAGLAGGNIRAVAKTTGTLPQIIDADGTQTDIIRRGKPNIKEQAWTVRKAARMNAQVLVAECMAVRPEYQRVSQQMLEADVAVITNIRPDHFEEMGHSLDEIARSVCQMLPTGGVVFTTEKNVLPIIQEEAAKRRCTVFSVKTDLDDLPNVDFAENEALALSVCEWLGVERSCAIEGIRKRYCRDPFAQEECRMGKHRFVSAFSANDPVSTQKALEHARNGEKRLILVMNQREDRPERARQCEYFAEQCAPDEVWLLGAYQKQMKAKLEKKGIRTRCMQIEDAAEAVRGLDEPTLLFGMGNLKGDGMAFIRMARSWTMREEENE